MSGLSFHPTIPPPSPTTMRVTKHHISKTFPSNCNPQELPPPPSSCINPFLQDSLRPEGDHPADHP